MHIQEAVDKQETILAHVTRYSEFHDFIEWIRFIPDICRKLKENSYKTPLKKMPGLAYVPSHKSIFIFALLALFNWRS